MPSESTDITDQILAHHEWFREQFVRLDDAKAAAPADADALRAVWDPLATKLDLHAIAEEEIFYPQLLRRGTEDPRGGHARRDRRPQRHPRRRARGRDATPSARRSGGRPSRQAREANDEHMAEEEREGIADFRANAPAGLREALGRQFARFFEQHPTTDGVNVSDKDPERYVEDIERDIAQTRTGDGSLGIGSLKGQRQL